MRPPKALVVVGGSAEDKVTYAFTYDGTVERSGESHGAPINDDGVTVDPDVDTISEDVSTAVSAVAATPTSSMAT